MPKTYSSDLFDLIHALSKSEKRFFKLYSAKSNSNDNKQYIKLFDTIDYQKKYNEEKIIKKVPEIKKFSVVKNQLYNLILKSISILHQEKRLSLNIRNKLDYIDILYHKGLYSQCEKLLIKSKKQAQKAELFEILLSIQKVEIKLLMGIRNFKNIESYQLKIANLQKERASISNKIQNIQNYFELYFPLTVLFHEGSRYSIQEKKKVIKETMTSPFLLDESKALSGLAKATFHMTWSMYYFLIKESEKAYAHAKKRLNILQEHPHLIEDSLIDYLNNIKFVSRLAIEENEYVEALTWIGLIQSEIDDFSKIVDIGIKSHFSYQIHIAKMDLFFHEKQWDDIIRYYEDIKSDLTINSQIENTVLLNIYFVLIQAYFFSNLQHKALKYINLILNIKFSGINSDKHRIIQFINILVHYELKNYDLLDYVIKSYQRATRKDTFNDNIDFLTCQLLSQKINSQKIADKTLTKIKSSLNTQDNNNHFLELFDLNLWIKNLKY